MQHIDLVEQRIEFSKGATTMGVGKGGGLGLVARVDADDFHIGAKDPVDAFDMQVRGKARADKTRADGVLLHGLFPVFDPLRLFGVQRCASFCERR